jgi:hypothetical protein
MSSLLNASVWKSFMFSRHDLQVGTDAGGGSIHLSVGLLREEVDDSAHTLMHEWR